VREKKRMDELNNEYLSYINSRTFVI
jgi:hypothetical protein